jgi:serine/threonine protein phosphatase PrpC
VSYARTRTHSRWTSAAATHRGQVRKVNEDAYLDRPDIGLWAVADGMGGHTAGNLASRMVVQELETASQQKFLGRAVANLGSSLVDANRQLCEEAIRRGAGIIGSTVAALLAIRGHCVLMWVGDSRIYRLRNGMLHRLSRDHSQVQELVDRGLLAPDSAEAHPAANVITRAVGAGQSLEIDAQIYEIKNEDRFLLCSDGLTKELTEHEIGEQLARIEVNELPQALLNQACERGARDNVTAVVVQFLRPD